MTLTTIGSNPTGNDWFFDASMNQAFIGTYSVGEVGRMVQVNATFASVSGGAGGACAWIGSGSAVLFQSQTIAAGTGSSIPTTGYASSGDIPFKGSDGWWFGFYASSGVYTAFHADAGNSWVSANGTSAVTETSNYSAYGVGGGSQIAYGTYFICQIRVRRGGAWTKILIDARRSSSWGSAPSGGGVVGFPRQVFVRRGGAWTQVAEVIRTGELEWKPEIRCMVMWPDGSFEEGIMNWEYDRPRYLGVGYPGWIPNEDRCVLPDDNERIAVAGGQVIRFNRERDHVFSSRT